MRCDVMWGEALSECGQWALCGRRREVVVNHLCFSRETREGARPPTLRICIWLLYQASPSEARRDQYI